MPRHPRGKDARSTRKRNLKPVPREPSSPQLLPSLQPRRVVLDLAHRTGHAAARAIDPDAARLRAGVDLRARDDTPTPALQRVFAGGLACGDRGVIFRALIAESARNHYEGGLVVIHERGGVVNGVTGPGLLRRFACGVPVTEVLQSSIRSRWADQSVLRGSGLNHGSSRVGTARTPPPTSALRRRITERLAELIPLTSEVLVPRRADREGLGILDYSIRDTVCERPQTTAAGTLQRPDTEEAPKMHRRLTYANVAATLALVLAMSGGAFAAGRYLINSTRQINPKVLRQLRGARGASGLRGATGAQGSEGKPGSTGTAGKEGPAGKEGRAGLPGSASLATAFVQMSFSAISLESTANLVLSTKEGKTLALPGAGAHVLVQATVQLEASGVAGAEVTCHLAVASLPAGAPVEFGEPSTVEISATGFKVNQVALTGNVSLVGGATYDPQVHCKKEGLAAVTVTRGSLNAVGYE